MLGKDRHGYVTPCRLGVPIVGKDQHGYITLAFSGILNRETESEVAAQIRKQGKCPLKTEHFEHKTHGVTCFTGPFKWGSKIFRPLCFGPLEGGLAQGLEGGCWGQGLHLGAPRDGSSRAPSCPAAGYNRSLHWPCW